MSRSAQHHRFSNVTRTPDNSNLFLYPLKVRVIGIRLHLFIKLRQVSGRDTTTAFSQLLWSRLRARPRHRKIHAHEYTFLDIIYCRLTGVTIIKITIIIIIILKIAIIYNYYYYYYHCLGILTRVAITGS